MIFLSFFNIQPILKCKMAKLVAVLDHIDFTSHNALLHNRRDGQSISFPRIGSFEQRIETTGFKKRFSDFLIIFEFF